MKKILIGLWIATSLFILLDFHRWTFTHPIKMFHFCPDLTRKIPVLKSIDNWFQASSGFEWYKVTHKVTGRKYLMKQGYTIIGEGREERGVSNYWVMDDLKRDKWVEFTDEQFHKSFGSKYAGEGLIEDKE